MDISNSTVKGKLSKAPETRIFYLWSKWLQFRTAAYFSIISKAECGFTTLNLGLLVNQGRNWALSAHFTFTKVKEKILLVHSKYNSNTFLISAELDYSKSDLTKQDTQRLSTESSVSEIRNERLKSTSAQ